MPMQREEIEALIRETFPDADIRVEGDDGMHMTATVVDESFRGMTRVQQQRAVYAAISHLMKGETAPVHAIDKMEIVVP